jgi:hypothetical protein
MLNFLKQSGLHEYLDAIFENDIVNYFEKLGIKKKQIDDGNIFDYCCKDAITLETFRFIPQNFWRTAANGMFFTNRDISYGKSCFAYER